VKSTLAAVTLLLFAAAAVAARAEPGRIDALLAAIEASGCRFERNGIQHSAPEGAAHLRTKLDRAGDRVQTAAQFIERIGTARSQSGRPYRVICAGQAPQESRLWLQRRLAELVSAGK
jgi:hypothetical protein